MPCLAAADGIALATPMSQVSDGGCGHGLRVVVHTAALRAQSTGTPVTTAAWNVTNPADAAFLAEVGRTSIHRATPLGALRGLIGCGGDEAAMLSSAHCLKRSLMT